MKFANYKLNARSVNNLGDQIQIIAIDRIYDIMSKSTTPPPPISTDIAYINYHELRNYDGEYVLLPVTMPMLDYFPRGIADRFSDRIIPVFLGFTMVKETLSSDEITYLKKYEPIGCRDERTLETMRRYGIFSYLHGCITVTLPRRNHTNGTAVYIVDVDERFIEAIPESLKRNAQYRTHFVSCKEPKERAMAQYKEYLDNASLVITSLLHCAIPCLAAGIPVILLKSSVSFRMAWLEKILPIYTLENINNINWEPVAPDIEEHKQRILDLTTQRFFDTYHKYKDICDLSYFYENRKEKHVYINDACESLRQFIYENWQDKNAEYKYSIWGLNQAAEWIVDYIDDKYPNSKLCHVYDTYRREPFHSLMSEDPSSIKEHVDETVLVTTNGAEKAALALFESIGFPEKQYSIFRSIF